MVEIKPYVRRANYYETDQMGIVHHSNYIRYFEEARIDLMRQVGLDCKKLEELNIIIPVLDAYGQYKKSVKFDDEVVIYTKLTKFTGVKLECSYEVRFKETNEIAAIGHTSHCFVDENFKPFSLKRKYPDIYEGFLELLEK
ncbi:acyl-CoA thioesterase [Clostridium sp. MSJ-8]|uniref:acyl-CoA thioesterase n=1 Tax=Clostridium sp. MSJ-8 TaxID=2841510 RepID=UPI001C0E9A16|nr:thioesterase family protein [Clostridium sp. MSJ-8]MBU5488639.1 acyl-CoA thioesterase [Clostridium sp. MSJ-8]